MNKVNLTQFDGTANSLMKKYIEGANSPISNATKKSQLMEVLDEMISTEKLQPGAIKKLKELRERVNMAPSEEKDKFLRIAKQHFYRFYLAGEGNGVIR